LRDLSKNGLIGAIGEHPGERAQKQHRQKIGERDETEPGTGMGQRPGQPADRDPLQPPADQRNAVAADINPEIAVRKGARDIAEPAGWTAQPLKGRGNSHPGRRIS
jgi:hypothetical protein